jgi:hypothetical protein
LSRAQWAALGSAIASTFASAGCSSTASATGDQGADSRSFQGDGGQPALPDASPSVADASTPTPDAGPAPTDATTSPPATEAAAGDEAATGVDPNALGCGSSTCDRATQVCICDPQPDGGGCSCQAVPCADGRTGCSCIGTWDCGNSTGSCAESAPGVFQVVPCTFASSSCYGSPPARRRRIRNRNVS